MILNISGLQLSQSPVRRRVYRMYGSKFHRKSDWATTIPHLRFSLHVNWCCWSSRCCRSGNVLRIQDYQRNCCRNPYYNRSFFRRRNLEAKDPRVDDVVRAVLCRLWCKFRAAPSLSSSNEADFVSSCQQLMSAFWVA